MTVRFWAIAVLNIIVTSDTTPWFSVYEYKLWPKVTIITKNYNNDNDDRIHVYSDWS